MDFTRITLRSLLSELKDFGYEFFTITQFLNKKEECQRRELVLRHDVDRNPVNSLYTASMEYDLDIRGTYYFRRIRRGSDAKIIREIAAKGHEIGYHYEDIDLISGCIKGGRRNSEGITEKDMATMAFKSFQENMSRLRAIVPINTICMHGSPMSRYDSRVLWKYFDYGDLGIESEPYFDFSFDKMLYLTDTGRRWDGDSFSVRDKVYSTDPGFYKEWVRKPVSGSAMAMTAPGKTLAARHRYTRTTEIINAARSSELPDKVMLTVHPQRWNDNYLRWSGELISQNIKNRIKAVIIKSNRNGI